MGWIFLIFVGLPLAELILLLRVGAWLGFWNTVGIIVLTALVGATVWRRQGTSILWTIRNRLRRNEVPARQLFEGVLILVAGAFFLTPGFITDTLGFLFLIPPARRVVLNKVYNWVKHKVEEGEMEIYVSGDPWDSS
jgi:UPF0716 protein FxsA